jgi:hypothetical protein
VGDDDGEAEGLGNNAGEGVGDSVGLAVTAGDGAAAGVGVPLLQAAASSSTGTIRRTQRR